MRFASASGSAWLLQLGATCDGITTRWFWARHVAVFRSTVVHNRGLLFTLQSLKLPTWIGRTRLSIPEASSGSVSSRTAENEIKDPLTSCLFCGDRRKCTEDESNKLDRWNRNGSQRRIHRPSFMKCGQLPYMLEITSGIVIKCAA